jgi:hypothetical protein
MNLRVSTLIAVAGATLAASCSSAPVADTRSPRDAQRLAQALSGRVAGPAVRCLPNYRTTDMEVVDDWTILFKEGSTVYVQNPRGGCRGLDNGGYTLVNRQFGVNQICDGDFNQLIDLRTNMYGGNCVYGPFIPYRRIAAAQGR